MPAAQERALKRVARKRGYGKRRTNAFVYGTMRHQGWKPRRERGKVGKTPHGARRPRKA